MKNILTKLHAMQAEIERMEKDGRNTLQNYTYLSETQVTLKIKELLDKHGVMFLPKSIEEKAITEISPTSKGTKQYVTTVKVSYIFADIETGETYEGSIEGQGTDTGDKGIYKAITGSIKYVYMKTFNIPTGDDPEKDTKKTSAGRYQQPTNTPTGLVNPKQLALIHILIEQSNADKQGIHTAYNITSLNELTSPQASTLIDQLKAKIAKAKGE
jgi:hypothetical protein